MKLKESDYTIFLGGNLKNRPSVQSGKSKKTWRLFSNAMD